MIIAALIFLGLLGSTGLASNSGSKKERKKLDHDDDGGGKLDIIDHYSWMKHYENPDTGDYIKHWIDINLK